MADEETALAKPVQLRPTLVSRLGLALLLTPIVGVAIASGAWLVVGTIGAAFAGTSFGILGGRHAALRDLPVCT